MNLNIRQSLSNKFVTFEKAPLAVKFFGLLVTASIIAIFINWILIHDIERDSIEFLQHNLFLWCGILSIFWVLKNKFYSAICIPIIYFYLFLDDKYSLHDIIVKNLFVHFDETIFTFPEDLFLPIDKLGEYTYWLFILLIFIFIFIFISFPGIKTNSSKVKIFIKSNFAIFLALSFFELFIDILYGFVNSDYALLNWFLRISLVSIEELGATIVLTFSCIRLFSLNLPKGYK